MRHRGCSLVTFSFVLVLTGACESFGGATSGGGPEVDGDDGDGSAAMPKDAGGTLEDRHVSGDGAPAIPSGMVLISSGEASVAPFYIDATEASVASFEKVRGENRWEDLKARLPLACSGSAKQGWGTRDDCPVDGHGPTLKLDEPVNCVDWCDALAYCVAQNKRLCGKIGAKFPAIASSSALEEAVVDPTIDEWTQACGGPTGKNVPNDAALVDNACNVDTTAPDPSGTRPTCFGFAAGLFDMVGNLNEWEDACTSPGESAQCTARGGSYRSGAENSGCLARHGNLLPVRLQPYDDVGIRCCADAPSG